MGGANLKLKYDCELRSAVHAVGILVQQKSGIPFYFWRNFVYTSYTPSSNTMASNISKKNTSVKDAASDVWSCVTHGATGLFEFVIHVATGLFEFVTHVATGLFEFVTHGATELFEFVTHVATGLFEFVTHVATGLFEFVTHVATGLFEFVTHVATGLFEFVTHGATELFEFVTHVATGLFEFVTHVATGFVAGGTTSFAGMKRFGTELWYCLTNLGGVIVRGVFSSVESVAQDTAKTRSPTQEGEEKDQESVSEEDAFWNAEDNGSPWTQSLQAILKKVQASSRDQDISVRSSVTEMEIAIKMFLKYGEGPHDEALAMLDRIGEREKILAVPQPDGSVVFVGEEGYRIVLSRPQVVKCWQYLEKKLLSLPSRCATFESVEEYLFIIFEEMISNNHRDIDE
jgi:hypothetical protein